MLGRLAQAETDIDNLQAEFNDGGRVKVAEGKIADLEAADEAIKGRLDVIEGEAAGSIKKAQADAEATAKSYTDGRETAIRSELKTAYEAYADQAETDAVTTANGYTDGKVATLSAKDAEIEGKVTTLQDIVNGYSTKGSIKTAVEAAQEQADKGVEDAGKAQAAADKAQGEVDALEGVVATLRGEYNVTKALATANEAAIAALDGRVEAAEGNITTLQGIVDSGEGKTIRDDVVALQTLTGANGAIRQEIAAAQKAGDDAAAAVDALSKGQVATNKTNIEGLDGRVTAIESDYLKAADTYIFNCGSSTLATHEAPKAE
jgi:chromosome segregation ATPase